MPGEASSKGLDGDGIWPMRNDIVQKGAFNSRRAYTRDILTSYMIYAQGGIQMYEWCNCYEENRWHYATSRHEQFMNYYLLRINKT